MAGADGSIFSFAYNQLVARGQSNWELAAGGYFGSDNQWRATGIGSEIISEVGLDQTIGFSINTGLTTGAVFTPVRQAYFGINNLTLVQNQTGGPYGLAINNGSIFVTGQPWNNVETINSSGSSFNVNNGGAQTITRRSGLIIVTETIHLGQTCIWAAGGGRVNLVGGSGGTYCDPSGTCSPPAGSFGMCNWAGDNYAVVNNTGNNTNFTVMTLITRNAM